jgi:hypothetical protein
MTKRNVEFRILNPEVSGSPLRYDVEGQRRRIACLRLRSGQESVKLIAKGIGGRIADSV